MRTIKLSFGNGITNALAGHALGVQTYMVQVKPYLIEGEKVILEFPKEIELLAISFVSGFLEELSLERFENLFEVHGHPKFVKRFMEDVYF